MQIGSFIQSFKVSKLVAPLIYPFRTALGQHDSLENVLFRLKLVNGIEGLGEAGIAPHITGETVAATVKNLNKLGQQLIGKDVRHYRKIILDVNAVLSTNRAGAAAVEMALLDALTKSRGIALWRFFSASAQRRRKIATDITIVISSLAETEAAVKKFYRQGFRAFKVKIGRDMDIDLKRVLAVRRLAPPSRIYLDANQGYAAKESIQFLKALRACGVRPALIEQPVPKDDLDGLSAVTRSRLTLVCADESVRTLSDSHKVIARRAADVINIKLMKSGFLESTAIARLARRRGLKLMMGAMMESNLAITAAAHFAAGLGGFNFIDLDPPFYIKGEAVQNPYLNQRGIYNLAKIKKGIGISKF